MNKAILQGRIGKDAEAKEVNGQWLIKFSLATSESYIDKQGERKKITEWHNVQYWCKSNKIAEHLTKGTQVLVDGKIKTNEHEGKYYTSIVAQNLEITFESKDESKKETSEPNMGQNSDLSKEEFEDYQPF
jgi:single-strand DNA-binding protein